MNKYKFTKSWFQVSEIRTNLHKYLNKKSKYNILEIGSFEGLSACFFSDNFLDNKESSLDCVDPFYISGTVEGITTQCVNANTINLFKENIKKSKNSNKIKHHRSTSDVFFNNNNKMFDFIYVDGNHEPKYIENDIKNSLKFINNNGIIWFDDYGGNTTNEGKIRYWFDKFLKFQKNNYNFEIIHKNYQLAIRVIKE
tara:strand:- start:5842 stop:6432 length:591 start_codon:yes stop_codon:yes gene_type:complete